MCCLTRSNRASSAIASARRCLAGPFRYYLDTYMTIGPRLSILGEGAGCSARRSTIASNALFAEPMVPTLR